MWGLVIEVLCWWLGWLVVVLGGVLFVVVGWLCGCFVVVVLMLVGIVSGVVLVW